MRTGTSNIRLLVVLPCYNEGECVAELLTKLQQLHIPGVDITALPVNDCSKDNTLDEIRRVTSTYLNLPVNLGIGGAVQSGFKYALNKGYEIAVQFDGDGQHPEDEIHSLIAPILAGEADVVIGSRFITRQGFQSSALRRTGINFFKNLNRLLLGIIITDSTSGFRALNRKAIAAACGYYPDEYPEPESIVLYHLSGLKLKEIPVVMRERAGGQSSIRSLGSVYYMIKVSLGILFIYFRLKFNGKRHTV